MSFSAGTLTYTKPALIALFAWLLWGDFCMVLVDVVVPAVLPLKLKELEAPNWVIGVIMSTLPGILNMTICPWVSYKSDRLRSRWGRRIPFILFTLPFLSASLFMIGWSEETSHWLHANIGFLQSFAPATLTIVLLGFFMFAFRFFDMFVGSVFHALFNDTVPAEFIGRFMGLFRIVGTAAGAFFNMFIFKYSETHMREIFTGLALLYLVVVGLMCLRVKEGEYPPVEEEEGSKSGWIAGLKNYGKESFSHGFYWLSYLTQASAVMAAGSSLFMVFFYKEMGLSLEQIGWLAGFGGIAGVVATIFAATFVDRWHPMRILTYLMIFTAVTGFYNWVWVPVTLPGHMFFWLGLGTTITAAFSTAMFGVSSFTALMRIYAKSRYAQLCSARAMVVSLASIAAGFAAGIFLDCLKPLWPGTDHFYRLIFLWAWPFSILAAVFNVMLYRQWMRMGGDEHFSAPAPWSPNGREELPSSKPMLLSPRLTRIGLNLFTWGFAGTLLLTPVFWFIMHRHGLAEASRWYLLGFVPAMAVLTYLWLRLARAVRSDVDLLVAGGKPRMGVPHYGILMVLGIQSLVAFPIYWMQIFWTSELDMQRELLFFAGAKILSSAAILVFVQVLRWVERPVQPDAQTNSEHAPIPTEAAIASRPL